MKSNKSDFEKQLDSESICELCHCEMKVVVKKGKQFKYDKNHTMYECSICGFKHRKRTQNEILRDLGEREDTNLNEIF